MAEAQGRLVEAVKAFVDAQGREEPKRIIEVAKNCSFLIWRVWFFRNY